MMRTLLPLAAVILVLSASPLAPAQENSSGELLTITDDVRFTTEVREVTVPVTVLGPKGEYVTGLEVADFELFDNEVKQQIGSFEVAFLPISMVVCVQSSDRIEGLIDHVKDTAILFTDLVLGEFGETALISFDGRVQLMTDFTSDTKKIDKALKDIRLGNSAVALSDAVYEAIRMLVRRPENHRKVVVVISESQNNGSRVDLGETLKRAQLENIMVYPVHLNTVKARLKAPPAPPADPFPQGVQARPYTPGAPQTPTAQQQARYSATPNVIPLIIDLVRGVKNIFVKSPLEVLAKGTGGEDFKPFTDEGIEEAIVKIGEDLRSQYLLTYRPNNLNEGGIFHRIRVETPYDGLEVRARPGYLYGPSPVPMGEPAP